MMRPFKGFRPVGPFMDMTSSGNDETFSWAVDDEIAHHIYQSTIDSNEVGFGSFTILIEAFMNFFPGRSETDSLNNWFFTRDSDGGYGMKDWLEVPSRMAIEPPLNDVKEFKTDVVFNESRERTNPEATKVTSQQYTANGAMFTYELRQDFGEPASAFIRVPVPSELSEKAKQLGDGTKLDYFEFQNREYSANFSDGSTPDGTYFHPHYTADNLQTPFEIEVFMDKAFSIMEEGVKLENRTMVAD